MKRSSVSASVITALFFLLAIGFVLFLERVATIRGALASASRQLANTGL
jgi:hypothetical protein